MSFREFLPDLVNYLDVENIIPFLVSKKLLSLKEMENLKLRSKDRGERVMELVSIMERKGSRSYAIFKEALRSSVSEENVDFHLGHVELLSKLPSTPVARTKIPTLGSSLLSENCPPEKFTECVQETTFLDVSSSGDFVSSRDSGVRSDTFCNLMQHPFGGGSVESQSSSRVFGRDLTGFESEDAGAELRSELSRWQRQLTSEADRQKRVADLATEVLLENRKLKEANGRLLREKSEMEYCMHFCMPAMMSDQVRSGSTGVSQAITKFLSLAIVHGCSKHASRG